MPGVIEIGLTRGFATLVDEADADLVRGRRWYAHVNARRRGLIYAWAWIDRTTYLHRLIVGAGSGQVVDHISGNTLDNRRCNLRIATPLQSMGNTRPRAGTSSRFKGVSKIRGQERWEAYIAVNQRKVNLGRFADELEAARAYDRAARVRFGEFARLNLPSEVAL